MAKIVMTYQDYSHPIKTYSYKSSYHGQMLMDLHKIFNLVSRWGTKHEVNFNFIPPHLPQVVMTYLDPSHALNTNAL